jgi:hypothetical protein
LEKVVSKFYISLWWSWAWRLSISTIVYTSLFSGLMTLILYLKEGMKPFHSELFEALVIIFEFWFLVFFGIALLLSLFQGLKHIFNHCHHTYSLELLSCPQEAKMQKIIGYGDLVKVWRKWFILLIWLVGAQMVLAVILSRLLSDTNSLVRWFNIYSLYGFILVAGYFSFILLVARCKKVRIVKC